MILAQLAQQIGHWGLVQWAIAIVIIAAIVALVYIALRQFGIAIPAWVVQAFWIVVVAIVIIGLIRFVAGL